MKEIVIATKNKGKIREMQDAFRDLPVTLLSLADLTGDFPDAIEDGATFQANSLKKARHYQALTGKACLADDSGLEVDVLGGAPGVYSARFSGENATDESNNAKLQAELKNHGVSCSRAAYQCALTFVDVDGSVRQSQGFCRGEIRNEARGDGGFGYDPYFYVGEKSMAQLSLAEKDAISHRGEALRQMAMLLKEYLK